MGKLSNNELLQLYQTASELQLEIDFISLLQQELNDRGLTEYKNP